VVIEEDAVRGPGVIVLPNVTIGRGAIVTAGSVVTKSVPPKTMVQGNPARPIAIVEVPLELDVSVKEFAKGLRSVAPAYPRDGTKEKGIHSVCVEALCPQTRLIPSRRQRPIRKFACMESVLLLLFLNISCSS
jgi:hypothetical protein